MLSFIVLMQCAVVKIFLLTNITNEFFLLLCHNCAGWCHSFMLCPCMSSFVISVANIVTKVTVKFIMLGFLMLYFIFYKNNLSTQFAEIFTFTIYANLHMSCCMMFKEELFITFTTHKVPFLIHLCWIANFYMVQQMGFPFEWFLAGFTYETLLVNHLGWSLYVN